jgi:predicted ester cyclase
MRDGRELVASLIDSFHRRDLSLAREVVGEDWVSHGAPLECRHGLPAFGAEARALLDAVCDLRFTAHDVICDGDRVAWRGTMSGRHVGAWNGLAPTGHPFAIDRVDVFRVAGGRLVEHWPLVDELSLLRQLGVLS